MCREGEEGDNLYVIQSGVFEAVKGSGDDEKLLFKYEDAGAFGELALMYNCRRAATVRVSLCLTAVMCRAPLLLEREQQTLQVPGDRLAASIA